MWGCVCRAPAWSSGVVWGCAPKLHGGRNARRSVPLLAPRVWCGGVRQNSTGGETPPVPFLCAVVFLCLWVVVSSKFFNATDAKKKVPPKKLNSNANETPFVSLRMIWRGQLVSVNPCRLAKPPHPPGRVTKGGNSLPPLYEKDIKTVQIHADGRQCEGDLAYKWNIVFFFFIYNMAKSSSFFGLRRGSTKSLTFSVLDGKQITKDRVTSVRNPKTNGQIRQRMKMTAVLIFARYFREFIERGQQGVTYGKKSYQAWLSQALRVPNLYAAKGQKILMPWGLPLTKGSLTPFSYGYTGIVDNLLLPAGTTDAENVTDAQILATNPQLQDGDQIAAIQLLKNADGSLLVKSAKHIINSEATAANSLAADFGSQDMEVTDQALGDGEDAPIGCAFGYAENVAGMVGFALILSRLNGSTFERSSQDLAVTDNYFNSNLINACYDSYRDASQRSTDWPEIVEEGFIPVGYSGMTLEGTDASDLPTFKKYTYVYGFNGSEFKRFLVGTAGVGQGHPTLYTYPTMESDTSVSTANATANSDGFISKADFDTMFA